ncbi:hypothetical protein GCM10027590_36330 [Nocardiopsis nanhaiensis]
MRGFASLAPADPSLSSTGQCNGPPQDPDKGRAHTRKAPRGPVQGGSTGSAPVSNPFWQPALYTIRPEQGKTHEHDLASLTSRIGHGPVVKSGAGRPR